MPISNAGGNIPPGQKLTGGRSKTRKIRHVPMIHGNPIATVKMLMHMIYLKGKSMNRRTRKNLRHKRT